MSAAGWERGLDGTLEMTQPGNPRTAIRKGGLLKICDGTGWWEVYRFASAATAARNGEDWMYQVIVPGRDPVKKTEWEAAAQPKPKSKSKSKKRRG